MHRWFLVAFILSVAAFRPTGLWVASPRAVSDPPDLRGRAVAPGPRRRQSRSVFDRPLIPALAYLIAIVVAELATLANYWVGLAAHTAILFALLLHGSGGPEHASAGLLWVLALSPSCGFLASRCHSRRSL